MNETEAQALKSLLTPHARELGYGTFSIFAKVHKNDIFDIDVQQFTTHSTPEGNTEAVKLIIKLIKGMQESLSQSKSPGTLTMTLDFNKQGQTTKIVVQNGDKHRMK